MITSIQATNFRRHAELDLRFDEGAQLILIAGPNGAGKTTVLEILDYALWGESRHGRRHLDTLVKRGSEIEGMSVEVTFTIGADLYRVHRRRDGKSSTAVLYCNDTPLVEGPMPVSEEISRIMGMDAAGFRLAVIAHQKDLDGLASLRPAERAQMITRLLRLDVLTSARNLANIRFRSERDLVQALASDDVAAIEAELTEIAELENASTGELDRARNEVAILDAELAAASDVDAAWQACGKNMARIEGSLDQLRARRAELEADLLALSIPEELPQVSDLAHLTEQVAAVESRIARAEVAGREERQRNVVADELSRAEHRIGEIDSHLTSLSANMSVKDAEAAFAEVKANVTNLTEERDNKKLALAQVQTSITRAEEQLAVSTGLGAECGTCGQPISDEHRDTQQNRLEAQLDELRAYYHQILDQGRAAQAALGQRASELEQLRNAVEHARAERVECERLGTERAELQRRINTYQRQLERLTSTPENLDALYAEKAQLSLTVSEAVERAEQARERFTALQRQGELQASLHACVESLTGRAADLEAARPGADLQARFQERADAVERRNSEIDILRHWQTQAAVLQERSDAARRRLGNARQAEERRGRHQQNAIHAAAAARLLGNTAEHLATQIRPSLEGAVGSLLTTMSDGRFTAVKVSDEYNITVEDDGKFRLLTELSGGEVDLIALAVRLALSQVVSERHGAGGAGFLILDECLGSQDPQRRQSIVTGLRALRDTYSQIFLISHVENIEDAADVVVNLAMSEDRRDVEVSVC